MGKRGFGAEQIFSKLRLIEVLKAQGKTDLTDFLHQSVHRQNNLDEFGFRTTESLAHQV